MVIIDTFAVIEESLYTVQFDNEDRDELQKAFNLWNDPQFLYDFFKEHKKDLQSGFYGEISITEAVRITRFEAKKLQKELFKLANEGLSGKGGNLSQLFKPIEAKELGKAYEKDKAHGLGKNSWLRLYAIRINVNVFVICGSAIKLTRTMNEKQHLTIELEKLETTKKYLKTDDYEDLFYELSL